MTPRLRLPNLDSIRGLAALVIFTVHFAGGFGPFILRLRTTPLSILVDSHAAVGMFFVLSGLVLSLNSFGAPGDFRIGAFYVRRFFRICGPLLGVLCVSWAVFQRVSPSVDSNPHATRWLLALLEGGREVSFPELLRQALLLIPDTLQPLIPQAWTLVIELKMSILVPFLILICVRSSAWLVAFAFAYVVLLGGSVYVVHFAAGILLARHHTTLVALATRLSPWAKAPILAGGLLLITLEKPFLEMFEGLPSDLNRALMAVGCASWLFVFSGSPWADRVLGLGPLQFLGRVSYSFYICHLTVLIALTPFALTGLNALGVAGRPAYWAAFVGSLAVSVACSWGSFEAFEKPSIALGRKLASRLAQPPR